MIKFILIALAVSSQAFSKDIPVTETPAIVSEETISKKAFNPRKGHFLTSFGFEGMKYDTPYNFDGAKTDFKPGEKELWGGRIGIGQEIYLGAGFNTTTKIETYYMGTLFSRVLNGGAQDSEVKFAYTKRTGQILGFDASQSIGRLFDFKTKNPFMEEWAYLTVEPFVEAGIGMAKAYNRLNYSYNLAGTNDRYLMRVNDDLTNVRLGGGVNLTSNQGYFFYLKATYNRYDLNKRKVTGFEGHGGTETALNTSKISDKIDPIMIYSLGGGYKF